MVSPKSFATPRTWATIDLDALRFNFAKAQQLCPHSSIVPIIKSDAYGHGMMQAARALVESETAFTTFGVATLAEALELTEAKLGKSVMLLGGCVNEEEIRLCIAHAIEPTVHSAYQLELIARILDSEYTSTPKKFWIKYNSGMNRLGQRQDESLACYRKLSSYPNTELVFMSHLAFADDMSSPASKQFTDNQIEAFNSAKTTLASEYPDLQTSLAASAGILTLPQTHNDIIRPGVMLYGSSPLAKQTGEDVGLRPVMTLSSRLMSINAVRAGETIGYNATYTCKQDMTIGVVSVGYGDGYPRSATDQTPVLVKTSNGVIRTHVVGRVSMDMITIDLSAVPAAQINDEVVLWGEGLQADEVAKTVGTIAYELFCKVTKRADFNYIN